MRIANMASYPARGDATLQQAVASIAAQVDLVNLCLNGFDAVPVWIAQHDNVNAFVPDLDYKDVGKFVVRPPDDADVFYVDDDIAYPTDYADYCVEVYRRHEAFAPIVGAHGVIYADLFDGNPLARNVFAFRRRLVSHRVVNQLGTGTAHCKGWQCPDLAFMRDSERFVDVRFARHAATNGWPMICIAREENWLRDLQPEDSIFDSFTKSWPLSVTREVQDIAGYGRLPLDAVAGVERTREAL